MVGKQPSNISVLDIKMFFFFILEYYRFKKKNVYCLNGYVKLFNYDDEMIFLTVSGPLYGPFFLFASCFETNNNKNNLQQKNFVCNSENYLLNFVLIYNKFNMQKKKKALG